MSIWPIASPMPMRPAGGANAAATSIPAAAPLTRLLRSDWTRLRAPATPAAKGSSSETVERMLVSIMSLVAIC